MADVSPRAERPLSPHLTVYRFQWTMILSISHRITGVALAIGAALVAWWLLAAATSPEAFATADGVLTSWIGDLVLLGSLFALTYHLLNGVRHLVWDAGYGFDLAVAETSAYATLIAAAVLTLLVLFLV